MLLLLERGEATGHLEAFDEVQKTTDGELSPDAWREAEGSEGQGGRGQGRGEAGLR
jgi:hypothetical protein